MPAPPPQTVALPLPRDELWTLHHAVLARLEAEETATDPAAIDSLPVAVYRVFEALDAGSTRVSLADLAVVLDELDHDGDCPPWCLGCARLTALCQQLRQVCEQHHASSMCETADE